MSASPAKKLDRLNLRASLEERTLIERGARAQGKNLTDFVLSSAYEKAQHVLADQRTFALSPKRWNEFLAALDRPVTRHKRLTKLMSEPSVLER